MSTIPGRKVIKRGDGWIRVRDGHWEATVVPWRVVDGEKMHTNQITEVPLGLDETLIFGWCEEGFYAAREIEHDPTPLIQHLDSIEWRRVKTVRDWFDIGGQGSRGVTTWDNRRVYMVSHRRWDRLLERCFKRVPGEEWVREVLWAKRWCNQRPLKPGTHLLYHDGIHVVY